MDKENCDNISGGDSKYNNSSGGGGGNSGGRDSASGSSGSGQPDANTLLDAASLFGKFGFDTFFKKKECTFIFIYFYYIGFS